MSGISDNVRRWDSVRSERKDAQKKEGAVNRRMMREAIHRNDFCVVDYITVGLTGKIKIIEAKLVAIELGRLINSALFENGSTIEERAQNREIGLRLAEYLAKILFDDKHEASAFLRGLRQLADEDIFIEKTDYYRSVHAFSTLQTIPVSGYIGMGEFFWYDSSLVSMEIYDNEVSETINRAIDSLSDETVTENLKQFLDKFNLLQCTMTDNVLDDIQRVLDIHKKLYA